METERINDANAADYAELLGEDEVKELNRLYYRGLGIRDKRGNAEAALIFRLDHLNDQDAVTEALILKLKGTPEQAGALLLTYSRLATSEDVRRTLFEAPFDEAAKLETVLMEYGFRTERREGRQLRLKLKELKDLHIKEGCPAAFIHDLNEINPGFLRRGILRCMHRENRVITGDLDLLAPEWFEQDISCYAEKDGELAGLLLVHRINETSLRVEFLSGISKTPPAETYTLIKQAIGAAEKKYPEETEIMISRPDKTAERFTEMLFPGKKGVEVLAGNRREMQRL